MGAIRQVDSQRRVRFILINAIRVILALVIIFALYQNRNLILLTSCIAFVMTFTQDIYKLIFKKESAALFDAIIIILIIGLFSFWEVKGVYSNYQILAFSMVFAEAIALGLLGLTVVYTFFKYSQIEEKAFAIAFFSFCFAFAFGTIFELGKYAIDSIFNFRIHEVGAFGTMGSIGAYFIGAFVISSAGYFSLKKGKPILVSKFLEDIVEKNSKFFGVKNIEESHEHHIKELIKKGESNKVEFKSSLRKNLYTNNMDKQIEHASLKSINAYLNTDGGTLLVGVSDKGELLGIDHDQFSSDDHAQRHLTQLINDHLGAEFLPLIESKMVKVDGKTIMKVDCKKSNKESFLKNGKEEHFYVRQGSLSMPLTGSALLKYIESTFRTKN